jgi:prepilin-type N-terminal cleavage/methylation domain-containing protein
VISATRALRGERGYSLVEMLTVLAIMSFVLAGVISLFVAGSNAQLEMNRRFEAQQNARVALDRMRREIHCSKGASTIAGTGESSAVTLRVASHCKTAVGGIDTDVTWCTSSAGANHWALHRQVGASCGSGGVKWADKLTGSVVFDYQTQSPDRLARLRVRLPIDVKVGDATPPYALCDVIVLRNSSRRVATSTDLGYQDTANLASC